MNPPLVQEGLSKPFCKVSKSKHFRFCKLHMEYAYSFLLTFYGASNMRDRSVVAYRPYKVGLRQNLAAGL